MSVLKSLLVSVARPVAAAAALAVLLGGCSGSTRVEPYVATALVAFGDELSLVNADGSKYTVNALKADGTTLDCAANPVWPQVVASGMGLTFAVCNPDKVAQPTAVMKASAGAKVADVAAAVQAYQAGNTFVPTTLVTLMAGQNDILAAYSAYLAGTLTRDQARDQVKAAGTVLGNLVNTIANKGSGARVLYATPPDLGYSPFATAEVTRTGNADLSQLLKDLTTDFSTAMRLQVINDGRYSALITSNELMIYMSDTTKMGTYGLTNITDPVCTSTGVVTACTTATIQAGAQGNSSQYLWADTKYPGANYQNRVGIAALNRARNNPF